VPVLKFILLKGKNQILVTIATFQKLYSPTWLVATILVSMVLEGKFKPLSMACMPLTIQLLSKIFRLVSIFIPYIRT
jgi:hypothetical protein